MSEKGFFASICNFFNGLFSSDSAQSGNSSSNTPAATTGLTGVERYIQKQANVTGVEQYIRNQANVTGVEQYIRNQAASTQSLTGVEKYIRNHANAAPMTSVEQYIRNLG